MIGDEQVVLPIPVGKGQIPCVHTLRAVKPSVPKVNPVDIVENVETQNNRRNDYELERQENRNEIGVKEPNPGGLWERRVGICAVPFFGLCVFGF